MSDRFTFWCRWYAPDTVPNEHMVARWPRGMKGWVSGYDSDDNTIWCARIDAVSAKEAEQAIRRCYGKSARKIRIDFINENPLGWRPGGGRFPE